MHEGHTHGTSSAIPLLPSGLLPFKAAPDGAARGLPSSLILSRPTGPSQPEGLLRPAALSPPDSLPLPAALSQPGTFSPPESLSQPDALSPPERLSQPVTLCHPSSLLRPVALLQPARIALHKAIFRTRRMRHNGQGWPFPFLLSLAFLLAAGCSSAPDTIGFDQKGYAKPDTGLYVHENPPFSILFPLEWEIQPGTNTYIRSISPYINPQDNFRESIGLHLFEIAPDVTLNEIYEANKVTVQRFKNHRIEKEESLRINERPARSIHVSYDLRPDMRLETLFLVSILETDSGHRGIILSGTALSTQMPEYTSIFRESFQTLRQGPPQDDSSRESTFWF